MMKIILQKPIWLDLFKEMGKQNVETGMELS